MPESDVDKALEKIWDRIKQKKTEVAKFLSKETLRALYIGKKLGLTVQEWGLTGQELAKDLDIKAGDIKREAELSELIGGQTLEGAKFLGKRLLEKLNYFKKSDIDLFKSIKNNKELRDYMRQVVKGERASPLPDFDQYTRIENKVAYNRTNLDSRDNSQVYIEKIIRRGLIVFKWQDAKFPKIKEVTSCKSYIIAYIKKDIFEEFIMLLPPFILADYGESLQLAFEKNKKDTATLIKIYKDIEEDYKYYLAEMADCIDFRKNDYIKDRKQYIEKGVHRGKHIILQKKYNYMTLLAPFIRIFEDSTMRYTIIGTEFFKHMNNKYKKKLLDEYGVIQLLDTRWNYPGIAENKNRAGGLIDIVYRIMMYVNRARARGSLFYTELRYDPEINFRTIDDHYQFDTDDEINFADEWEQLVEQEVKEPGQDVRPVVESALFYLDKVNHLLPSYLGGPLNIKHGPMTRREAELEERKRTFLYKIKKIFKKVPEEIRESRPRRKPKSKPASRRKPEPEPEPEIGADLPPPPQRPGPRRKRKSKSKVRGILEGPPVLPPDYDSGIGLGLMEPPQRPPPTEPPEPSFEEVIGELIDDFVQTQEALEVRLKFGRKRRKRRN